MEECFLQNPIAKVSIQLDHRQSLMKKNAAGEDALIQITTNSQLYVKNSNFTENYSFGRGSIIFGDYQSAYALFENCLLQKNYAFSGGVFYSSYDTILEFSNSTITENFGIVGGVGYINNEGIAKINKGTYVAQNQALNTCFLFIINSAIPSEIDGITITQNDQRIQIIDKWNFTNIKTTYKHFDEKFFKQVLTNADQISKIINEVTDSSIIAIKSQLQISNTMIFNNDLFLSASTESRIIFENVEIKNLYATGKIIQTVFSEFHAVSLNISNITVNKSDEGSGFYKIYIENTSKMRARNLNISLIDNNVLYVADSELIIEGSSTISQVHSNDTRQSIIYIDSTNFSISNTTLSSLKSDYDLPIMSLSNNNATFNSLTVRDYDKLLMTAAEGNYIFDKINLTDFKYDPLNKGYISSSQVLEFHNADLKINNSFFKGVKSLYASPVIYIKSDDLEDKKTLELYNSKFQDNVAGKSAGVIYSENTDIIIDQCQFLNNHALDGDAGVLHIQSNSESLTQFYYFIKNSVFENNSASEDGGVVKFSYFKPDFTQNNTFRNNTASYGPIIGSYPVQISIMDTTSLRHLSSQMLNDSQIASLNLTNVLVFEMKTPLVSGNLLTQPISLVIMDEMGIRINTDNISVAELVPVNPDKVQLFKSKSVKAKNGVLTFDDVIVVAKPGSRILLKVKVDSIDQAKILNAFNLESLVKDVYILAQMRLCIKGEAETQDLKCVQCNEGFYTVLDNQTECQPCPNNSICQEGYKIIPNQGYWRRNITSIDIYKCQNSEACISDYVPTCAPGYKGNLCQSCTQYNGEYYARTDNYTCSKCLDQTTNSWRLAGVCIVIILYLIVLIAVNIKTINQQKMTTVYFRIMTNYFQIVILASSYQLSWEENLKRLFEATSYIGRTSDMIISQDCFIYEKNYELDPIYLKLYVACFLPLGFICILAVFWTIVKIFKRSVKIIDNFLVSVIVIVFILMPAVTSIGFSIFSCKDLFGDGNKYLELDYEIKCWEGDHLFYAYAVGAPILVVWVIGLPLVLFFIMFQRRQQLSEEQNIRRFGFIYVGLNHDSFYWEILIHFRKIGYILINIFLLDLHPIYRSCFRNSNLIKPKVLIFWNIKPLQLEQYYLTQFFQFATFYGGIYYISSDLPSAGQLILFIIILFANIIFLLNWFRNVFNYYVYYATRILFKYFPCIKKARITQARRLDQDITNLDDESLSKNDNSYRKMPETQVLQSKVEIQSSTKKNDFDHIDSLVKDVTLVSKNTIKNLKNKSNRIRSTTNTNEMEFNSMQTRTKATRITSNKVKTGIIISQQNSIQSPDLPHSKNNSSEQIHDKTITDNITPVVYQSATNYTGGDVQNIIFDHIKQRKNKKKKQPNGQSTPAVTTNNGSRIVTYDESNKDYVKTKKKRENQLKTPQPIAKNLDEESMSRNLIFQGSEDSLSVIQQMSDEEKIFQSGTPASYQPKPLKMNELMVSKDQKQEESQSTNKDPATYYSVQKYKNKKKKKEKKGPSDSIIFDEPQPEVQKEVKQEEESKAKKRFSQTVKNVLQTAKILKHKFLPSDKEYSEEDKNDEDYKNYTVKGQKSKEKKHKDQKKKMHKTQKPELVKKTSNDTFEVSSDGENEVIKKKGNKVPEYGPLEENGGEQSQNTKRD